MNNTDDDLLVEFHRAVRTKYKIHTISEWFEDNYKRFLDVESNVQLFSKGVK